MPSSFSRGFTAAVLFAAVAVSAVSVAPAATAQAPSDARAPRAMQNQQHGMGPRSEQRHRANCFDAPYGSEDWRRCEQRYPDQAKREHYMGPPQQRKN